MRYIKGAAAVVVLSLIVIFSVQNLEAIEVSFLTWSMNVPKFLVIIGNYLLGMITGAWLFDFLKQVLKSKHESK